MFFLFFSVFIFRSWQLKSPKSATTWNTSSSAPPVTLWNHMTWHSHTFVLLMHTIVASLAHENWIAPIYSVAASVAGTCTCVSWPIRGDWVFRRGALKRQVLKKKNCRQYCMGKWASFLSIKACKQYHCVQRLSLKYTQYMCGKTRIQWWEIELFNFD